MHARPDSDCTEDGYVRFLVVYVLKEGDNPPRAEGDDLLLVISEMKRISPHRLGREFPSLAKHLPMVPIVRPPFSDVSRSAG